MRSTYSRWAFSTLLFSFILLLWEWISHFNATLHFVFPPPTEIASALWENPTIFFANTLYTLQEMVIGLAIALIAAFPFAILMLVSRSINYLLHPLFIIVQSIPMFALAPIMLLWFDWSIWAVLVPTALMIFFPFTLNLYQGIRATPQAYLEFFKINGATSWQILVKLRLPWALPHLFSGLRISTAIAGIGAVAGEWAGAQKGLGVLMIEMKKGADIAGCFAALFCLILLSLSGYCAVSFLEKITLHYKRSSTLFSPYTKTIASLLLLILPLLGCEKKPLPSEEVTLLLDWMPNPNHVPLYAGIREGIFQKNGIDLQLKKLSDTGSTIPLITSGSCDLAIYYMPHTIRAYHKGASFQVVAALFKQPLNALIIPKKENIASIDQLQGIAVGAPFAQVETTFVQQFLQKRHILLGSIKKINFDITNAVLAERIQAFLGGCFNIEAVQLEHLGIPCTIIPLSAFNIPPYYELVILASMRLVSLRPEMIPRFQKALQESITFSQNNPEQAFDAYLTYNPDKTQKTIAWEKKAWAITAPLYPKDPTLELKVWQEYQDFLLENAVIGEKKELGSLLHKSLKYEEALCSQN